MTSHGLRLQALAALFCCTAGTASAQWINHPTAGIPRTADGKPNLTAPAPRVTPAQPDLSGLWRLKPQADVAKLIKEAGVTPEAQRQHDRFMHELGRDDPTVRCLPLGPRATLSYGFAARFIQSPQIVAILYEDLTYRQIFMDGRELPKDPNPTWLGYSVGRWDGDTLVVTSTGFTERSPLDFEGYPHTEALRVTERFRRTDFGHMEVQVTFEDPAVIVKPVTVPVTAEFVADTDMLEYVCQENERSRQRLVGTMDDDKKLRVEVAREVLTRYAGTYRLIGPDGVPIVLTVTPGAGELTIDVENQGTMTAIPVSASRFLAQGVAIEFFGAANGPASEVVVTIVEGDLKGVRVP
jgi:hypothetical protein